MSVGEMLKLALAEPDYVPPVIGGVRHSAAQFAQHCRALLGRGEDLGSCWRFGVLQTLDYYMSYYRAGGSELAKGVFDEAPAATGAPELDAAFAALAEYLAVRDGWEAPSWVNDAFRVTEPWYPLVMKLDITEANEQSPQAFKDRGIFITSRSLLRA